MLNLESLRLGINQESFLNNNPDSLTKGRLKQIDPMADFDYQV